MKNYHFEIKEEFKFGGISSYIGLDDRLYIWKGREFNIIDNIKQVIRKEYIPTRIHSIYEWNNKRRTIKTNASHSTRGT